MGCCAKTDDGYYKGFSHSDEERSFSRKCLRCSIITLIVLSVLVLILFILVFVVVPLIFMNSIGFQRFMVFLNIDNPKDPNYSNASVYGVDHVQNFYLSVNEDFYSKKDILSLGIWFIPHVNTSDPTKDFNELIAEAEFPILLYMHGVACNRALPTVAYNAFRKNFHVIAMDYRAFGDSTDKPLSEEGTASDAAQVYTWIKSKNSTADVYIWAHSLGTGISGSAVELLRKKDLLPMGIMLESPFTSLDEELEYHPLGKVFKWLPYFDATFREPLKENGFIFDTISHLQDFNCPIMIFHAEDDFIIPFKLGKKLYENTNKTRKENQGDVLFHGFPSNLKYNHVGIPSDPNIPKYQREFIEICEQYYRKSNKF